MTSDLRVILVDRMNDLTDGALTFSLTTGDVFSIGDDEYVVTRIIAQSGQPLEMAVEMTDGSKRGHYFRKQRWEDDGGTPL